MRWENGRESQNVEDRRGQRPVRRGLALGGGGIFLLLVVSLLTGRNPLELLGSLEELGGGGTPPGEVQTTPSLPQDQLGKFASVVLATTEDAWNELLPPMGKQYTEPRLVLFSEAVDSACGFSSAATGPFYCPLDHKVYLDLSFFRELSQRFGAPGDFGAAYVIAHEVGHHVQNLLGIAGQVRDLQERSGAEQANALSVRMELQADCLAGVWGHYVKNASLIEPGDFEEGLRAAAAIGDDRMQRLGRGVVQPESWTHGSSEQRMQWLRRGLNSGNPEVCNTFSQ